MFFRHEEEHAEAEYLGAHGVATTIHGKKAVIGSRHFIFEDGGIPLTNERKSYIDSQVGGDLAIFLAVDVLEAGSSW